MISLAIGLNFATWASKEIGDKIKYKWRRLAFINYCNRKVIKFSSESSVLLNNRKHSPREITTLNDFAISYFSKGFVKNLNCKSTERPIKCPHLAYWWVKQDKPKYNNIDTLEKLQNCQEIPSDEVHIREVLHNGCASEVIYFDLSRFPKALHEIASRLKQGEKKQWYLQSTNHTMGVSIKQCGNNRIVIHYYDPNDTLRHKKIVVESPDKLLGLTPEVFWNDYKQDLYFPEKNKVGCLFSSDKKAYRDDCQVTCMANPNDTLMYHLLNLGHYGHRNAAIDDHQINPSVESFQGFYSALENGHSEAVRDYMKKVLARDDLSDEKKKELLAIKKTKELLAIKKTDVTSGLLTPGFFLPLQNGHSETVAIFLQEVLASDLPSEIKEWLLTAKREDGTSGPFMAFQEGYSEAVRIFLKEVLESHDLSDEQKAELLAAKDKNDRFGFFVSLKNGHSKTVEIFLKAVLESHDLSDEQKAELLIKAVRTRDNIGGLTSRASEWSQ